MSTARTPKPGDGPGPPAARQSWSLGLAESPCESGQAAPGSNVTRTVSTRLGHGDSGGAPRWSPSGCGHCQVSLRRPCPRPTPPPRDIKVAAFSGMHPEAPRSPGTINHPAGLHKKTLLREKPGSERRPTAVRQEHALGQASRQQGRVINTLVTPHPREGTLQSAPAQ